MQHHTQTHFNFSAPCSSKTLTTVAFTLTTLLFSTFAQAQTMRSILVENNTIGINENAKITVSSMGDAIRIYCGIHVNWGDGVITNHKMNSDTPFPGNFTHPYAAAGTYNVLVSGGKVTTHLPCAGGPFNATIQVGAAVPAAVRPAAPNANQAPSPVANAASANATAAANLEQKAMAGDVAAQTEIGLQLYNAKRPADAARWFQKAADAGHAPALNNLGFLYSRGDGVLQDTKEAGKLYEKAASLGYVQSIYNYGEILAAAAKTEAEFVTAYTWLNVATARLNEPAQRDKAAAKRDEIKARITTAAGQTRAQQQSLDLDKRIPR